MGTTPTTHHHKHASRIMGVPELTYFDAPGRGSLARLCFAAGGVKYKDTRVGFSDMPKLKADKTSTVAQCFGSLPVLEHDGFMLCQSLAVAGYASDLALADRLGSDPVIAKKNRAVDTWAAQTNEDLKAATEKLNVVVPKFFGGFGRALERKKTAGPFFFSQQGPSLADLAVFDVVHSAFPGLLKLGQDLSAFPKCLKLVAAVKADARIAVLPE